MRQTTKKSSEEGVAAFASKLRAWLLQDPEARSKVYFCYGKGAVPVAKPYGEIKHVSEICSNVPTFLFGGSGNQNTIRFLKRHGIVADFCVYPSGKHGVHCYQFSVPLLHQRRSVRPPLWLVSDTDSCIREDSAKARRRKRSLHELRSKVKALEEENKKQKKLVKDLQSMAVGALCMLASHSEATANVLELSQRRETQSVREIGKARRFMVSREREQKVREAALTEAESLPLMTTNKSDDRRQASDKDRLKALLYAMELGYEHNAKGNKRVAEAAIRKASVLGGFKKPFASSNTLKRWWNNLRFSETSAEKPGRPGRRCINEIYDNDILRRTWREAEAKLGHQAPFTRIARFFTESGVRVSASSLHRWFVGQGGEEYAEVCRPRLSEENKATRLAWFKERLSEPREILRAHLDEKWFYTSSRRRKKKRLPRVEGESESVGERIREQRTSRRFPVKIMCLGVVARPQPEHNFDGKIGMWRVADMRPLRRAVVHRNLSHDIATNEAITSKWRQVVHEDMTVREMQDAIASSWNVDAPVEKLAFLYRKSPRGCVSYVSQTLRLEGVQLENVDLVVRLRKGDMIIEDKTCDSKFMLGVMRQVGKRIREKYSWVPRSTPIVLQQDRAGGHGTKAAIEEYTNFLRDDYGVVLDFQPSNSPESNMLDLGVWRSLQSTVEKMHYEKRQNTVALFETMKKAWHEEFDESVLTIVHERLYDVAQEVVRANGDNVSVEWTRGVTKKRLRELSSACRRREPCVRMDAGESES